MSCRYRFRDNHVDSTSVRNCFDSFPTGKSVFLLPIRSAACSQMPARSPQPRSWCATTRGARPCHRSTRVCARASCSRTPPPRRETTMPSTSVSHYLTHSYNVGAGTTAIHKSMVPRNTLLTGTGWRYKP